MKNLGIIATLGTIALAGLLVFTTYVSAYNRANAHEQGLKQARSNSEMIFANYGPMIMEAAQITEMQRDDLVAIFTGANEARYGADGSKAVMQWLTEQNPNLDQKTYVKVQQMIEAGRAEFKTSQTMMLDRKRAYETELNSFMTGAMMRFAGYPKLDLESFKIVSTAEADRAFTSGRQDGAIKLRPTP